MQKDGSSSMAQAHMAVNLDKSKTFDTEAGPVTITGIDLNAPEESCVNGYIRARPTYASHIPWNTT